jgi:dihydrofolate reductase
MRRLIYGMLVSLDGFVAASDGNLDWHLIDEELHTYFNNQESAVDTWLYGRRMYELMAEFWPTADQDPSAPGYVVEFARIWRKMPKVVFSTTLGRVGWNARLVRNNVAEEVTRLKGQPGKDLEVGGAELASTLMRLGLIDEYRLYVQPVILGSGKRMFSVLDERINLRFVESRTFGSGVVLLRYQRADQGKGGTA